MASKFLQRLTLAAVLAGGMGLWLAHAATAAPLPGVRRTNRPTAARGFNLFAGQVQLTINTNRVQCGMNVLGEQCVDATNSPTLGGGFWPKGSPDQYNFNGGLQIAAVIPDTGAFASFAWGGDTVGAYFFDGRGDQTVGQGVTNMYSSNFKDDVDNWPSAGFVKDPSLFHVSLLGRAAISQQDTWVRYWDGNVNLLTGRDHPMGILVDQRTMVWNFPSGNQDIIYFVERFINISATDPAKYAGLAAYGYSAADIADIVQVAQTYHDAVLAKFGVDIPAAGYPLERLYAGPQEDPDVVAGGTGNYSTGNLPFSMDFAYHGVFYAPTWQYPSDIFFGPFPRVPGFQGNKFLKGPADAQGNQIGITMLTNTTNGGVFPDRFGSQAMWRLASNNLLAVDGQCNAPLNTPMCQMVQTQADTRMYIFSGPLTINPGESQVVVFADVYAAAYGPAIQNDGIGHLLGSTSFDMKPGFPGTPAGFVNGNSRVGQNGVLDTLRMIDRATGWNSTGPNVNNLDASGDGILQQDEIPVIKGSLLDKALVAQAVFDAKFLLPFAPDAPPFYLIPADNQVTVVWQQSPTETPGNGDPYFAVASDPLTQLYDQDYRANDVEGYRIYRGRTQSALTLIAQYDYAGTYMTDYTGQFSNVDYGSRCAPEIGVTSSCPTFPHNVALVGDVVQYKLGGRDVAASGDVINTKGDTAITGGASGFPGLTDTGVPFSYVDNSVRDGFRYFYAVTAFDVNSVKSGPSSLESAKVTKSVTPRAPSGQEVVGTLSAPQLIGTDGTVLDQNAALPTIDPATGIFSGPMPPTNGITAGFSAFLPQVLVAGNVTVTVDSVIPGENMVGDIHTVYWFTGKGAGAPVQFSASFSRAAVATGSGTVSGSANFLATAMDSAAAARFGGDNTYSLYGSVTVQDAGNYRLGSKARADANGDPTGPNNGPRWWAGAANENTDDPNGADCYAQMGSYSCTLADLSRNAGAIAGVDIFSIRAYQTVSGTTPARNIEGITSSVMRAADFRWYWGANGAVDSVVDVTHHVHVPFSPKLRASWGILNDSSFVGTTGSADGNNALLTWSDYACVDPIPAYLGLCGGSQAVFQDHARLTPVAFQSSSYAGTSALATNGNGFILYLNGEFFVMRMASLPATGTVWNMRDYTGNVTGYAGSYGFQGALRGPAVPGLRVQLNYTGSTVDPSVTADSLLARIHTVPDPYYVTDQLEITADTKVLRFVNLPSQAIIRIYSVSGILVNLLTHNDNTGGGEEVWNLRNRNNQFVASGVYFYHVETPDGRKKIGRFTVVNYAQ